ncbi:putative transcription factor HB-other family [Rosa chinensis]|uniref:Putative transcription factor HB-other family n=1 Tax=Rosa chinensis TaxID=74649 RepID=A0A2P6RTL4_ROSCH|nr:putative transcription factor HB-other family [Rosa chinensis]
MEPRTLQLMELQTQQQMELQAQQPTEEGGSIQAAGSSNRWAPTPPQLRILKGLYYDKGFKYPTPEQIQEICLHLKHMGRSRTKTSSFGSRTSRLVRGRS